MNTDVSVNAADLFSTRSHRQCFTVYYYNVVSHVWTVYRFLTDLHQTITKWGTLSGTLPVGFYVTVEGIPSHNQEYLMYSGQSKPQLRLMDSLIVDEYNAALHDAFEFGGMFIGKTTGVIGYYPFIIDNEIKFSNLVMNGEDFKRWIELNNSDFRKRYMNDREAFFFEYSYNTEPVLVKEYFNKF